ncbi:hypothetical protein B7494_g2445 [Chlorociboria aeruginascens]|nr:hypothetical protein B7494_g2445 [Chlorociboria aeruginascens]
MASPLKIVLITGANSGVGYGTSQVIASASPQYHVIMTGRSLEKVKTALSEIEAEGVKGSLSALQLDVTDEASIDAAVLKVTEQFGRIDVLVNNAAIASQDLNLKKQFETSFLTNVTGPALVTNAFEPLLLKSKSPYLLFISSGLGSFGLATDPNGQDYNVPYPVYRSCKSALNMLAVDYSKTLGKQGVKVFAVCPGLVRSNLRGTSEEARSYGGMAGDPKISGNLILDIMEGKRDIDVGKFVKKDGLWPW